MRMRIAFFNWRDIRNPLAGGSEVYVHEILSRLAGRGHQVALFTSTFRDSAPTEIIDGIQHIRYGGKYSMFAKTESCYSKKVRGKYDVVAESINGVPFFTPLFSKERTVALIHQLTRENWFSGLVFPAALIGYYAEDALLSFYRDAKCVVPSASTKSDLEGLGFSDVSTIHGASNISAGAMEGKEKALLYLGRLARSKRVGDVIKAFRIIHESNPGYSLWIAGTGKEYHALRKLADSMGLPVRFFGFVSEAKKAELLSKAAVLLFPAKREGWGLVVLEANSCYTPVIGYDVHGLRDSIRPGINGALVREGDVEGLAESVLEMIADESLLEKLCQSSKEYSRKFSWEKSASEFESIFEQVIS